MNPSPEFPMILEQAPPNPAPAPPAIPSSSHHTISDSRWNPAHLNPFSALKEQLDFDGSIIADKDPRYHMVAVKSVPDVATSCPIINGKFKPSFDTTTGQPVPLNESPISNYEDWIDNVVADSKDDGNQTIHQWPNQATNEGPKVVNVGKSKHAANRALPDVQQLNPISVHTAPSKHPMTSDINNLALPPGHTSHPHDYILNPIVVNTFINHPDDNIPGHPK
ncbi:hypothetical protein DSO57_1031896 [Entomophthora muscae]|uniref:Uncharacterized protein n=1 Tax=Entomophthora muscae TaxID=34485 RepID=A0ACC2SPJ6_9FUNG|nr:hypothetical protein DSO57_1031896 [Entomophthora muscae]